MTGSIEILPYALPLAQDYRWARGVQRERRGLLVRVAAWDVEGWGEAAPPIHLDTDPAALAAEARALVGGLPVEAEDFLDMLDGRDVPPRLAKLGTQGRPAGGGVMRCFLWAAFR